MPSHETSNNGSRTRILSTAPPGVITTYWAKIEEHLKKHDEGSFKKYDDDMNTLLVFAGLFSAILTAFIIEFYKLLQADTSQISLVLLSQISGKLDRSSISSTPHDTAASNALSPLSAPFHPALDSTWINTLWFISLLLSLAAAFFAMVAKQWLREYLMWTTFSADTSEVVILRQSRAEAWQKWRVPAIIGAIPALLEIALILFLAGIIILAWTLDNVVAIATTVFASTFLFFAVSVTILPTFRHECPYKSPLGWAINMLWNNILQLFPDWIFPHKEIWGLRRHAHLSATTWVWRDLYRIIGVPRIRTKERLGSDQLAEYVSEVLVAMARSLAWVKKRSDDTELRTSVDHCTDSIHEEANKLVTRTIIPNQHPRQRTIHQLNCALLAACKLLNIEIHDIRQAVRSTYVVRPPSRRVPELSDWTHCLMRQDGCILAETIRSAVCGPHGSDPRFRAIDDEYITITIQILVTALKHAVQHLFRSKGRIPLPIAQSSTPVINQNGILAGGTIHEFGQPAAEHDPGPLSSQAPHSALQPLPASMDARTRSGHWPVLQRDELDIFVTVFYLAEAIITLHHTENGVSCEAEYIKLIEDLYKKLSKHTSLDLQYPGLRTALFQTLSMIGNPEQLIPIGLHKDLAGGFDITDNSDRANRYALLACGIHPGKASFSCPEQRHMFVVVADHAFQLRQHLSHEALEKLTQLAARAASDSLAELRHNCGSYFDLPWLDTLRKHAREAEVGPVFITLLKILKDNASKDLLTGNAVLEGIQFLDSSLRIARATENKALVPYKPIGLRPTPSTDSDHAHCHTSLDNLLRLMRPRYGAPIVSPPTAASLTRTPSLPSGHQFTIPEVRSPEAALRRGVSSHHWQGYPSSDRVEQSTTHASLRSPPNPTIGNANNV